MTFIRPWGSYHQHELAVNEDVEAGETILKEMPLVTGCTPNYVDVPPSDSLQCHYCMLPRSHQLDHGSARKWKQCPSCSACSWCSEQCYSADAAAHTSSNECELYKQVDVCKALGIWARDVSCALRLLSLGSIQPPLVANTQHVLSILAAEKGQDWLETLVKLYANLPQGGWEGRCTDALAKERFERALTTVIVNTVEISDPTCAIQPIALYKTLCRINHSCRPNSRYHFDGSQVSVQLLVNVPVGHAITISYIDCLQPAKMRQAELFERYGFLCRCVRCQEDEDWQQRGCSTLEASVAEELQSVLNCAYSLISKQEQAMESFMLGHRCLSGLLCRGVVSLKDFHFMQVLGLMASAAVICAKSMAILDERVCWWCRALCCRLLLCSCTEAMVSQGESGVLPHAATHRTELIASAAATLADIAASLPSGGATIGPTTYCPAAATSDACLSDEWTSDIDQQLWHAATRASGVCWAVFHHQMEKRETPHLERVHTIRAEALTVQQLQTPAEDREHLLQDLYAVLDKSSCIFNGYARKLVEQPWLLLPRLHMA